MAKPSIQEIKSIIAELSDVDSKNEQKILAIVSWGGREDTIDIRKYNVKDEIALKGISLKPSEAEELIYSLLGSAEISYDIERVRDIIDNRQNSIVEIDKLADSLKDDEDDDIDITDIGDSDDDSIESEDLEYRTVYGNNGYMRIIPKKDSILPKGIISKSKSVGGMK